MSTTTTVSPLTASLSPHGSHRSATYSTATTMPQQVEALQDALQAMRRQEEVYYASHTPTCMPWRPILVQWMTSVVQVFSLAPQIVATGMYFADAFHDEWRDVSYPLLGMACLELAIKLHDTKLFPLDHLANMGPIPVTVQEIVELEGRLLQASKWKLNPPTPHCFVHQYGQVLGLVLPDTAKVSKVVERALSLVQRCLYNGNLPPAVCAYAAMLAAMEDSLYGLSLDTKQSFCQHILALTSLSASSAGLAQAYRLMLQSNSTSGSKQQQSRNTTSSPTCSMATPTVKPSIPAPPLVQQPYSAPQTVAVPPPRAVSPTFGVPSSFLQPQHQRYASPHQTSAASSYTTTAAPLQKLEMIYSAGDDLGFEVTLNPAYKSTTVQHGMSSLLQEDWSPRNIMGAASPERM